MVINQFCRGSPKIPSPKFCNCLNTKNSHKCKIFGSTPLLESLFLVQEKIRTYRSNMCYSGVTFTKFDCFLENNCKILTFLAIFSKKYQLLKKLLQRNTFLIFINIINFKRGVLLKVCIYEYILYYKTFAKLQKKQNKLI